MENRTTFVLNNIELEKKLTDNNNQNLDILNTLYQLKISHGYNQLVCEDLNNHVKNQLDTLLTILDIFEKDKIEWSSRDFTHIATAIKNSTNLEKLEDEIISFYKHKEVVVYTRDGKKIVPKTIIQKRYLEKLEKSAIVFATGAAGSGKTYLAVAYAVSKLKKNEIRKLVISRPVVEAGERLGFLPGDLKEKVDPYLIPIYDCLYELLGKETCEKLIEKGTIEIAPLAYMRGRTLDNAIIILDEAQNTTKSQMKMFLTRLGYSSKMIITGDLSQIDLDKPSMSGLLESMNLLKDIKGISMIHFSNLDCMRHPLVSKIIEAYEEKNND